MLFDVRASRVNGVLSRNRETAEGRLGKRGVHFSSLPQASLHRFLRLRDETRLSQQPGTSSVIHIEETARSLKTPIHNYITPVW